MRRLSAGLLCGLLALAAPSWASAGEWDTRNGTLLAVPGVAAAGIYTQAGVADAQSKLALTPGDVAALVNALGAGTSAKLGGELFLEVHGVDGAIVLQKGPTSLVVFKTKTRLLVVRGADGVSGRLLLDDTFAAFTALKDL